RTGAHVDGHPVVGRVRGLGPVAQLQRGERVVRGEPRRVRGAHQAPAPGRQTPSRAAASATAAATDGATRGSSGPGMIASGRNAPATTAAIASAAASFMPSVTRVAPASSAPRKNPGKASTLLIWLG